MFAGQRGFADVRDSVAAGENSDATRVAAGAFAVGQLLTAI
jgi:hypothetical protein